MISSLAPSLSRSFRPRSPSRSRTLRQFQIDDLLQVVGRQVAEDDHVVQPVEELGPEDLFDPLVDAVLHALVRSVVVGPLEAESRFVLDRLGAGVGGHDQDRVAEVDVAAKAVRQPAFFHHLQQHVEHVGMRLLDLVQQDDGVGPAANFLGQLAAFLEADVARRSADQAADVVLLHVLAHVDLDQRVVVAEHELGQRLGQQRLADAGGPGEDEAAGGPLGVLQPAAAAAHGLLDPLDRLVLADDPLVQLGLHLHQAHAVFGGHPGERDAGHLARPLRRSLPRRPRRRPRAISRASRG